ncbi:MAG: hypothetical protein ACI86S_002011 [Paracoccaceae bacterium]|jgi:hypothetical protein
MDIRAAITCIWICSYLDLQLGIDHGGERHVRFLVGSLRFIAYVLPGPLPATLARYANSQDAYVNDTTPHSTLRHWRTHLNHPATLVVLLGIASVLAIAGPFDAEDRLRLGPRFNYWLVTVGAAFSARYLSANLVQRHLAPRLSRVMHVLVGGVATGSAVLLVVLGINFATLRFWPTGPDLPLFLFNIFAIAVIITLVLQSIDRQLQPASTQTTPLLDRLPLDKRGPLVALTVEDHYDRIPTTKGQNIALMRLRDAIKEVVATGGMQVHRAHWVAKPRMTSASRTGDRAILPMTVGRDIPVSRRYVPAIKEAGLLPR